MFIATKASFASNDFQTSTKAMYTIYDTGITHIVFNITLTNTSSKFFASSYTLNPGISDIRNLSVSDPLGAITPKLISGKNGKSILVNFNSKVAGFGRKLPFTISLDTSDVAKREGRIWEINIPGLPVSNDYSNFSAFVTVPASFGNPSYIKPNSEYQDFEYKNHTFVFSKNELEHSGISMGFGNMQIYSFTISYHIKNHNLFPITETIALPPSTNYQTVYIESISKKPENVVVDKDGNWLARYYLYPSEEKNITVKGIAKVFLTPKEEIGKHLSDYLKSDPNWQIDNPQIQKLGKKLKTPKAIYNYVASHLHYDFSRVLDNKPRLGALDALDNPKSAVCLEFTDLFIALSRSAGIPAREIDGFAYTTNIKERPLSLVKDILHAWPEYYDYSKKTWIMVDPTWGNTTNGVDYFNTMDFDHFAFVIKGENSTYPIPAGGYKTGNTQNEKDVEVKFINKYNASPAKFSFQTDIAKKSLSELPINGSITISNTGSSILASQTIVITSDLFPKKQIIKSSEVPPYGFLKIPFYLESPNFLTNKISEVKITVAGKTFIYSVDIVPFNSKMLYIGGAIIAIFIAFLSFIAARARNLSIFR